MFVRIRRHGLAHLSLRAPATVVVLVLAACGGSGGGPGAANPPAAAPPASPAATLTVTLSATGASPRELRVPAGSRVTFVNQDNRTHQMMSDPHPVHTDCPEINAVGTIDRGETKTTDTLGVRKACGFHDNMRDGDTTLRGMILVGGANPEPGYPY